MITGENVTAAKQDFQENTPGQTGAYDPFVRGRFSVGVRTIQALDNVRERLFQCEIWYPASAKYTCQDMAPETQDLFALPPGDTLRRQAAIRNAAAFPGTYPLIIFSHHSGGHRRAATFLCTHLSSHGYIVAALDHSEVVASELKRRDGETSEQKTARWEALIASRVPDVLFLLEHLLSSAGWNSEARLDPTRIGILGHSFGGWTALAAPDVERRIRAAVALAPGGSSQPRPGVLPVKLNFSWSRDVPTLFLVAENDITLPLAGMYEIFERTPATKQMIILRRADHLHFVDDVEQMHETLRKMPLSGELAWLAKEMRPMTELCSEEHAHTFVRGLTLCHMDAALKRQQEARRLLAGDVEAKLAARGVAVIAHKPPL